MSGRFRRWLLRLRGLGVNVLPLQRLPEGPQGPHDLEFYTLSYEEQALIGASPFKESFAIGDLPAGLYRVTFARHGVQRFLVEVQPGKLTLTTMRVE